MELGKFNPAGTPGETPAGTLGPGNYTPAPRTEYDITVRRHRELVELTHVRTTPTVLRKLCAQSGMSIARWVLLDDGSVEAYVSPVRDPYTGEPAKVGGRLHGSIGPKGMRPAELVL